MAKMHIAHPKYPELVLCGRTRDFVRRNVVPMDWPHLDVNDCRTCLMRRESMRLRPERKTSLPNAKDQGADK